MIYLPTSDPERLLRLIKEAIDASRITSWMYDEDGDFTLKMEMWNQKAWVTPIIENQSLNFSIFRPKNSVITKAIYAVYHARLVESVLRFLDKELTGNPSVSTFPEPEDDVG